MTSAIAEKPRTERRDPFTLMRRLTEDMDRMFGRRRSLFPDLLAFRTPEVEAWMPDIEVLTRNGNFIVRADLPGLELKDLKVEVNDSLLTIEGERKHEKEEKGEAFYTCERSYGSFSRTVPLPEGVKADQAKATFKNGVLEVTMPAPKVETTPGRKLDVKAV